MTIRKKELLKKLYALAERGERGEREAARKRLDALLQKYDIAEAELSDDTLAQHWYAYANEWEKKLFTQVCYKIAPDRPIYKLNRGKGMRTQRCVKCTQAEAVQIGVEFDFYKQLWKEEQEFFFSAFIQKHRIFDLSPGHKTSEPLDREQLFRMSALMNGMQDRELYQMIEEAK